MATNNINKIKSWLQGTLNILCKDNISIRIDQSPNNPNYFRFLVTCSIRDYKYLSEEAYKARNGIGSIVRRMALKLDMLSVVRYESV